MPSSRPPNSISVAQSILMLLESEGVECVFGIPGGPLTALFEAMAERRKIRLVLAKHEAGAAFMAAAHARVSRRLAVCVATSGPGATNALTGIASAYADQLPGLFLTGQVATNVFGMGAIQESSVHGTDLVSLFRPVTKLSAMLPSVRRGPEIVRSAIRLAMTGRPGPVHISLPADLLTRPVSPQPIHVADKPTPCPRPVDREAIDRAARTLAASEVPCILAGHGAMLSDASDPLLKLAHALQAPVATSPKGKGVFPEQDPLSLGVLGFGGHDLAERYIETAGVDALLVVGSSMNEFVTNAWTLRMDPRTAIIQVDIDPAAIGRNYRSQVGVVGDARASLEELVQRIGGGRASAPSLGHRSTARLHELRQTVPRHLAAESIESDSVPIKPQRLVKELRAAMPDDAMLFVDNGTAIVWATHYFEARVPGTVFLDLGLAAMGSAVAGVVGGALADRSRRAVALVGDAAFAMNGIEVHTAVEERLPVVWVVLNNGGHGMVHQGDVLMKGRDLGVSLFRVPIDAAAFARSLGARGVRVSTPAAFRDALGEALTAEEPTVIDAVIDAAEAVPTLIRRVKSLASYFAGRRDEA
jgi:acetolactate synthase I/II/III large subunit